MTTVKPVGLLLSLIDFFSENGDQDGSKVYSTINRNNAWLGGSLDTQWERLTEAIVSS